jgi:hypothetical protein
VIILVNFFQPELERKCLSAWEEIVLQAFLPTLPFWFITLEHLYYTLILKTSQKDFPALTGIFPKIYSKITCASF